MMPTLGGCSIIVDVVGVALKDLDMNSCIVA